MDILPVDLKTLKNCGFDGNEVDVLQLNGEQIWIKTNDLLVLNCSSVKFSTENVADMPIGYYLWFNINAIGNTSIVFNDFRLELQAGESQTVKIFNGVAEEQTGDLTIIGKCEFSTTTAGASSLRFRPFLLNGIKQWETSLDYVPDHFLEYCELNGGIDIHIPNNIKKIGYGSFGDGNFQPFKNSNIYLPSNLEEYCFDSFGLYNLPLNFNNDGTMAYVDDCLICRVNVLVSATDYVVNAKTRLLPNGYETTSTLTNDEYIVWRNITNVDLSQATLLNKIPKYCFAQGVKSSIIMPPNITEIGEYSFYNQSSLKSITIPETVDKICDSAFYGSSSLKTITFNTPADKEITLGNQLFYYKSAKSVAIYTENETIKNYDWAADNITPTFYHLDGTAWA